MATAREHMAADMAWLFSQEGEEASAIVIDGTSRRAIVQELEVIPGGYEGAATRRQSLWLAKGTITLPRPGYVMTVAGQKWTVESIDPTGLCDMLTLAQY